MTLKSRFSVLLIEDSPFDADLLAISLEDIPSASFTIDTVETLAAGIQHLSVNHYDVVLLDLRCRCGKPHHYDATANTYRCYRFTDPPQWLQPR